MSDDRESPGFRRGEKVKRQLVPERLRRGPSGQVVERVASEVDDLALVPLTFSRGAVGMFATGWEGARSAHLLCRRVGHPVQRRFAANTEEGGLLARDDGRTENAASLFAREADPALPMVTTTGAYDRSPSRDLTGAGAWPGAGAYSSFRGATCARWAGRGASPGPCGAGYARARSARPSSGPPGWRSARAPRRGSSAR